MSFFSNLKLNLRYFTISMKAYEAINKLSGEVIDREKDREIIDRVYHELSLVVPMFIFSDLAKKVKLSSEDPNKKLKRLMNLNSITYSSIKKISLFLMIKNTFYLREDLLAKETKTN